MINTIILGNALNVLPKLPAESVNCCVCSPPYWSLRDYGVEPVIWDGDKDCKHEWGNKNITLKHKSGETNPGKESRFKDRGASDDRGNCFCLKCGGWRGSLGLEPTFDLYIEHLCQIFDEVKRVLRKDGTCFINIGDSYGGSGNASGHTKDTKNLGYKTLEMGATQGNQRTTGQYAKSLLDIPYRFSIEMINRGWIKRNTIIWWKPNCMPSSADDRFTIDFEYLFFFVKNNKTLFWTNEKTLECVSKKPLGIKGIEGKDWEWRPCPACSNKNYFNHRTRDVIRKEKDCPQFKASDKEKENIKKKICPRCEGLRKVKYSFWTSHDYWFEQQFEEQSSNTHFKGIGPKTTSKFKDKSMRANNKVSHKDWHEYTPLTELPQGRNKRCVWVITTQPFPEAHFAVYPEGLIEIPIKAGCPEFICKKCGKARVKMYKDTGDLIGLGGYGSKTATHIKVSPTSSLLTKKVKEKGFIGYSDCGCNAGFESGVVLDPFMGVGTTALVALKQRKRFIGIEIKQGYIDMSYKRIARIQQEIF